MTIVRHSSVRFGPKFGILANRANTNGSVLVSTVGTILNRHMSGSLVHGKYRGTAISTIFNGLCSRAVVFLGRFSISPSRSNGVLVAEGLSLGKGNLVGIGNIPIATTVLHRVTRDLVGVRNRRSGRTLLVPRGRVKCVSTVTRSGGLGRRCCDRFGGLGGVQGRLHSLRVSRSRGTEGVSVLGCRVTRVRGTTLGINRDRRLGTRLGVTRGCRTACGTLSGTRFLLLNSSGASNTLARLHGTGGRLLTIRTVGDRGLDRTVGLVRSLHSSVNSCLDGSRCSSLGPSRVGRELSYVSHIILGCNNDRRGTVRFLTSFRMRLRAVTLSSGHVARLSSSLSGSAMELVTLTRGLARVHGATTGRFTRRISTVLGSLGVPGMGFATGFGGNGCAGGNYSRVRFVVSTGVNRALGPLRGVTSNNRLSHMVLTVGDILLSGSAINAVVFSRVSANVDKCTTSGITGRLGFITGGHRMVYIARLTRVTTTTGRRLLVGGSARGNHAFAGMGSLVCRRGVIRVTHVVSNASVASGLCGSTGRLLSEDGVV